MSYKEQILNYMNNNKGYINNQAVKELNVPTIYLTRMANEGLIDRVSRGIYMLPNLFDDELYINYMRYKKIIYTGNTALVLNKMSSRPLKKIEANVPANYNSSKIEAVTIHRVNKINYYLGKTLKETDFGNMVPCYDVERTVCDIFINNVLDSEAINFALTQAKAQGLNYEKLFVYSKKLGIYEKMKILFEVWL